jgi:hypothetical protein
MPRKKKVQKTALEIWQEQNENTRQELEKAKQFVDEAIQIADKILQKAKAIEANNPMNCNNCKYRSRCPWVIENRVPEPNSACLKQTLLPGVFRTFVIQNEAKRFLETRGAFLN